MKTKKLLVFLLIAALVFASVSASVSAIVIPQDVKNVILMIGDGMGENSLEWTKEERGVSLFMDSMPYQGYSKTDSLSGQTDSAAGGTALACGLHNFNSNLGALAVNIKGNGAIFCTYLNVCEAAKSLGKRAGVVTSDENSGATPAAFSAHTYKRQLAEEITNQQLACNLDLLWAASNGLVTPARCAEAGWAFADSLRSLQALPTGERSFAAISGSIYCRTGAEDDAPLSELTAMAIDRLNNDSGFFLMVEGAHIDKKSHVNNSEEMMNAVIEFDRAVEAAVDFAKEDGNTIVIVTADHETGGIQRNKETGKFAYTSGDHSRADVPLRLFGCDSLVKNGEHVRNTEVAKLIAKKLGYQKRFPEITLNPTFIPELFSALFAAIVQKDAA